jgi:hypothetical protein
MPTEVAIAPSYESASTSRRERRTLPTRSGIARSQTWTVDRWSLHAAVGLIIGLSILLATIGADARWLAALGNDVLAGGRIPAGIPFAAAPAAHWHNVTVLAEVVFAALVSALGDRGLVFAQTLAVAIAFAVLARDALRAGASRQATASTCLLVALGAVASLVVARVQMFSLVLFPLLLALLRNDSRRRSSRIWLVAPLLALWSNLHGAVLVGLLVTLAYLTLARLRERPVETIAVATACAVALCTNPGGIHALSYYHGVLSNVAAKRGEGMWGPLSPTSPLDALFMATGVILGSRAARARPAVWEGIVLLLLAVVTLHAARSGVWLLFMLVTPAAVGTRPGGAWRRRTVLIAGAALAVIVLGALRGPSPSGADSRTIARAMELARGTPVLADDIVAEQIALAGGKVWASDPIDAFGTRTQASYLDWLDGRRDGLAAIGTRVRVVVVRSGSPEAVLMQRTPSFRAVARGRSFEILERTPASR